jgi:hypothetical protein
VKERVITLQLRPRQALLLNMMYTLAGAIMNHEPELAATLLRSCRDFAAFVRSHGPVEVQDLTDKISHIRNAFTTQELKESGIANFVTDPGTGDLVRERTE